MSIRSPWRRHRIAGDPSSRLTGPPATPSPTSGGRPAIVDLAAPAPLLLGLVSETGERAHVELRPSGTARCAVSGWTGAVELVCDGALRPGSLIRGWFDDGRRAASMAVTMVDAMAAVGSVVVVDGTSLRVFRTELIDDEGERPGPAAAAAARALDRNIGVWRSAAHRLELPADHAWRRVIDERIVLLEHIEVADLGGLTPPSGVLLGLRQLMQRTPRPAGLVRRSLRIADDELALVLDGAADDAGIDLRPTVRDLQRSIARASIDGAPSESPIG